MLIEEIAAVLAVHSRVVPVEHKTTRINNMNIFYREFPMPRFIF